MSNKALWRGAILLTLLIGGFLGYVLFSNSDFAVANRILFLPGNTTEGHHQIELACSACHKPFQGSPQKACENCHGKALKEAEDIHANRKFSDPRNAAMLKHVNALACVTCHREHKPGLVREMDVTLPDDFCFACHDDIAKERPSHRDFDSKGCASGGCHNYHDEKALYEDFLAHHLHEPETLRPAILPSRNLTKQIVPDKIKPSLSEAEKDAPLNAQSPEKIVKDWARTAHAKAGINCSDCHQAKPSGGAVGIWKDKLDHKACENCHKSEVAGFLSGKHGMRLNQGLSAMQPVQARLSMKQDSLNKELSCASCHEAHAFDTQNAAVDACLTCHDDTHSKNYKQSIHFSLWQKEMTGEKEKGSGVSCATCHIPRNLDKDGVSVHVEHNQSMNLHPNEKMVRGVCMQCHGLGFTLDSLADKNLIKNNFNGKPSRHIKSIDMVEERIRLKPEKQK